MNDKIWTCCDIDMTDEEFAKHLKDKHGVDIG